MPSTTEQPIRGLSWPLLALTLGCLLVLYYLVPLLTLFVSQSPASILSKMTTPTVLSAASNSVLTALSTTLLALVFGVPLAYWLARTDVRWNRAIDAIVVLPLVLPPTVGGIVLLTVVGPNTLLGTAGSWAGIDLTHSLAGVVLAQTFVASPFTVVTARAAFGSVDVRLERASRSLGKGRFTTFRHVTLPLAWPGIVAGLTLTFARAMGEFGATLMLAYYPRTMPTQIWVTFIERGLENAYPLAILLVVISVFVLVVLNAIGSNPWGTS